MTGLVERPCARNPATPNPAAKIAAVMRCSDTDPSVAAGPMPGSGPPGSTSMSGLPRIRPFGKHDEHQRGGGADRTGSGFARQATNRVPATSSANTIIAVSAWKLFSTIRVAPSR